MEHTNERHIDIHVTGPAERRAEAITALNALGYVEKAISWRDAFPPEMIDNEGGTILKATRERKGMSQKLLADKTGIPQPNISEMERGRRPIGKKTAGSLAEALGVNYRIFL